MLSLGVAFALLITLVAACSGPEEKKQKFFNKGKSLYEKGDFVKAGLEFRNAIQIDPKFADAHYMLGMVELKKKNPRKAFGALSKAVELKPNLQEAQVQLGNIYMMARQPEKALEKAETVLKLSNTNEDALLLKASALLSMKKSPEALSLLQEMQQRGIKRPELFLLLASSHLQNNRLPEAEGILNEGITVNPKSVILHLTLANLYSQEKYSRAIEEFKKVGPLGDGNKADAALFKIGMSYLKMEQQSQALNAFKQLEKQFPGSELLEKAQQYLTTQEKF